MKRAKHFNTKKLTLLIVKSDGTCSTTYLRGFNNEILREDIKPA